MLNDNPRLQIYKKTIKKNDLYDFVVNLIENNNLKQITQLYFWQKFEIIQNQKICHLIIDKIEQNQDILTNIELIKIISLNPIIINSLLERIFCLLIDKIEVLSILFQNLFFLLQEFNFSFDFREIIFASFIKKCDSIIPIPIDDKYIKNVRKLCEDFSQFYFDFQKLESLLNSNSENSQLVNLVIQILKEKSVENKIKYSDSIKIYKELFYLIRNGRDENKISELISNSDDLKMLLSLKYQLAKNESEKIKVSYFVKLLEISDTFDVSNIFFGNISFIIKNDDLFDRFMVKLDWNNLDTSNLASLISFSAKNNNFRKSIIIFYEILANRILGAKFVIGKIDPEIINVLLLFDFELWNLFKLNKTNEIETQLKEIYINLTNLISFLPEIDKSFAAIFFEHLISLYSDDINQWIKYARFLQFAHFGFIDQLKLIKRTFIFCKSEKTRMIEFYIQMSNSVYKFFRIEKNNKSLEIEKLIIEIEEIINKIELQKKYSQNINHFIAINDNKKTIKFVSQFPEKEEKITIDKSVNNQTSVILTSILETHNQNNSPKKIETEITQIYPVPLIQEKIKIETVSSKKESDQIPPLELPVMSIEIKESDAITVFIGNLHPETEYADVEKLVI